MVGMKKLFAWFPWCSAFILLVLVFGTIYAAVQHAQRTEANSPQMQLAEDAADQLNSGATPSVITTKRVKMDRSLAPFTIVYDKTGKVLSSEGYINNKVPEAPIGILQASEGKNHYVVTWQPQSNVRIAAVTVSANKYYVLSGRSLREVEKYERQTFQLAFLGGVMSTFILAAIYIYKRAQTT